MIRVKYRLKCILGIKGLPAWGIALPLILATLFYISVGNFSLRAEEKLIPIGIVTDFEVTGTDIFPKERFKVYELTQTLAERYLEEGIISAYLEITEESSRLVALKSDEAQIESLAYADAYRNHVDKKVIENMLDERIVEKNDLNSTTTERHIQMIIITCLSMLLPTAILISEVRQNRKSAMMRHHIALVSSGNLIVCDTVITASFILLISTVVYAYMFYMVQPII